MRITAPGTATPAKVIVIGAGVAGLQAIAPPRRLGPVVPGYDVRAAAPTGWAAAYHDTVRGVVRAGGEACRASGMRYALIRTDAPFGTALGLALRG